MAKRQRRPVEPGATGNDGGPRRDRRGRFTKGGTRGGGAGTHAYVKRRAALAKALQNSMSPTAFKRLVLKMYNLALAGNVQAGMFLITQLAGKAPEPLNLAQMKAPARVTRQAPMDIEAIATGLQRVYEDYQSGRLSESEAGIMRAMLSSLLEVRKVEEIARKLETIEELLQRGNHHA
jgi:hypothetical protein